MKQLALDLIAVPPPDFGNFVVGPNGEAHEALMAAAHGRPAARSILLWGPTGSGKTHLLRALSGQAGADAHWLDGDGDTLPDTPILLADDVDRWPSSMQARLFLLLNRLRARSGSVLVATSSHPPGGMALREDLRTRLAAGLVIGLQPLSDDSKGDALARHAHARGLRPDPAVIRWLLTHQRRDLGHLLACLDALDRLALERRRPLTIALARELTGQSAPGD